jgi:hypothetical protein
MTSSIPNNIQRHTPLVGDVNNKRGIAYQASRTAIAEFKGKNPRTFAEIALKSLHANQLQVFPFSTSMSGA